MDELHIIVLDDDDETRHAMTEEQIVKNAQLIAQEVQEAGPANTGYSVDIRWSFGGSYFYSDRETVGPSPAPCQPQN